MRNLFQSIPVEKFGKEMAMKITNIIKKCLEPEEFRPDMRRILSTFWKKSSSSESRSGWCSVERGTSIEGKIASSQSHDNIGFKTKGRFQIK